MIELNDEVWRVFKHEKGSTVEEWRIPAAVTSRLKVLDFIRAKARQSFTGDEADSDPFAFRVRKESVDGRFVYSSGAEPAYAASLWLNGEIEP